MKDSQPQVQKIIIDSLKDVENQYLNLYTMMKPEDYKHVETFPQFDGEYCTMVAEGYVKRQPDFE